MTSPRLVQIHRYIALALGAFIVVMGLTGASLVFRDEFTAWFTPAVRIDSSTPASGQYERVLAAARRAEPQATSIEIVPSLRADRAPELIVLSARGERHLFVDPHDGSVVADSDRQWLPFATFFQLHKRFMAGEFGEYLVAVAGSALALLAVTGLILWWPRKLKYAFRVRWSGNRLAVSFDLHRCVGAAFAVFLLVNAVTGVTMNLETASPALVNRLAFSQDEPRPPAASSSALVAMKGLDEIVAAAERAVPGGAVTRIAIGDGNAPVVVRKVLPTDNATHGMNRIYVDGATATVLRASLLDRLPPGNAMFEWLYPLHTGKLLGVPYKFLLMLVGLVPLISLVTGLIVWRTRAAPKRSAASNSVRISNAAR